MGLSRTWLLPVLASLGVACAPDDADLFERGAPAPACDGASVGEAAEPGGVHGFASEAELVARLDELDARRGVLAAGCGEGAALGAAGPVEAGRPSELEPGVDAGDIVKQAGAHLVVLRRGMLYAVEASGAAPERLVDAIAVAGEGAPPGDAWYDEVLVRGELVYVAGFRRGEGGASAPGKAELRSFRLSNGKFTRLHGVAFESYDYFASGANASRLAGDQLVFFTRYPLERGPGGAPDYPELLEAGGDGQLRALGPLFGAADVVTAAVEPSARPAFYTVVRCALPDSGELACRARSLLGAGSRLTHVSAGALYLWADSHVYRFDLASLDVTTHRARGLPVDAFSLRERGGELLALSNRQLGLGGVELLRLPLAAFDRAGAQPVAATPVHEARPAYEGRFAGDSLVAALGASDPSTEGTTELISLDLATGASSLVPSGPVARIEPLDGGRVLVVAGEGGPGGGASGVALRVLPIGDLGRTLGELRLEGLVEGEGRSRGFSFRAEAEGAGTFGLALTGEPDETASRGFGRRASSLGFFDLSAAGALTYLGLVAPAQPEAECGGSCVDWYGNTRPVFAGDRAYALMGGELAPLALRPGVGRRGDAVLLGPGGAAP
ncbi:MAG TPA: hypothetical protein VFS43_42370 [Polyangiaceae bacterium]|nr:hypothetical protein [Polyangiaceae bacterium]